MTRVCLVLIALSMTAQASRGSIAGRITDAATGQPIAGAQVMVSQSDAGRTTAADSDGRYQLAGMGSGQYRVRVTAAGYVAREFGDAHLLGHTPIALLGRNLTGIDIAMHRGATITGRVVDEAGRPMAAVAVRAFRLSADRGNQLISTASRIMGVSFGVDPRGQADDRGEYRITSVAPGEYLIGVVDRTVTTYAPATRTRADATVVSVGLAGESAARTGIDITATRGRAGTIRGVVTGPGSAGPPIPLVDVTLLPDPDDGSISPLRAPRAPERYGIGPDGRFEFVDLPAGRYTLFARPGGVIEAPGVWGRASIVVRPDAVVEPTIVLQETGRVSGHLTAPLMRMTYQLELQPVPTDREAYRARARVASDGTFAFAGLAPGQYRWAQSQTLVGTGPRVLTAVLDNRDVTNVPLVVSPATAIENFKLVVEIAATIQGTVRDAAGAPTSAGAIVIASVDPRDWTDISTRLRVVRADQEGNFEARGLPPGRYRVAHVIRLPHERLWDAAFLTGLTRASEVTATAGQAVTVDLRVN